MFLLYLAGDLYHILVLIGFYRSQSLRQNYMKIVYLGSRRQGREIRSPRAGAGCVVTSKVREAGMAEYFGEINPC